uniref:Uncharacterized protein n=1 Tax=Mustela putorius furo TaxID=9669 RepID=M3XVB2_MUSPF
MGGQDQEARAQDLSPSRDGAGRRPQTRGPPRPRNLPSLPRPPSHSLPSISGLSLRASGSHRPSSPSPTGLRGSRRKCLTDDKTCLVV